MPSVAAAMKNSEMTMSFEKASTLLDAIEEESLVLDEVFRIKLLLDHSQEQPGKLIIESLRLLQLMELPLEIIKATDISSSVKCMLKNTNERIKQLAEVISLGWTILLNDWMHETKDTTKTTTPDTVFSFHAEEEQQLLFSDEKITFPPLDVEDLFAAQSVNLSKNSIANFFDGIDDDESEGVSKTTDKESHFDCNIIEKKDNVEKKKKKRPRIIVKPLRPRTNTNETVYPMNARSPIISTSELVKDLKKVNANKITEEKAEGLGFQDKSVIKKRKLLSEKYEQAKKDNGEMKRPRIVVLALKAQRNYNVMASPMNAASPLTQDLKESIADKNIKEKSKALAFQDKPEIKKRKLPPERYQEKNNANQKQNNNVRDMKSSPKQVFKKTNTSEKYSKLLQTQDSFRGASKLTPHVQEVSRAEKLNYEDKLEITKKRLHERYENANNERKKHRTKLIELNELQGRQHEKEIKPKVKHGCRISTWTKVRPNHGYCPIIRQG